MRNLFSISNETHPDPLSLAMCNSCNQGLGTGNLWMHESLAMLTSILESECERPECPSDCIDPGVEVRNRTMSDQDGPWIFSPNLLNVFCGSIQQDSFNLSYVYHSWKGQLMIEIDPDALSF